jgi:hypothetical protein
MFLCIRSSVSKLKNHSVFYTPKNNVLTCIFYFNNLFIEVKRTLAKISKTIFFFLFCVVLVSGITNLYVKCIPDIKKVFSFDDIEQLGFYPIRKGSPYRGGLFLNRR